MVNTRPGLLAHPASHRTNRTPPGSKGNDHAERPSTRPADRGRWLHHDPGPGKVLGPPGQGTRPETARRVRPPGPGGHRRTAGQRTRHQRRRARGRPLPAHPDPGRRHTAVRGRGRAATPSRPPHRRVERDDDRDVDPDSENGRGLFLVDALAHRWGSRLVEEGKEVWFELEIDASGGAGHDAAETDVHLPAPARPPRPQESQGCTELDHERADHQYSPDGERAEDLGLLGCFEDLGRLGCSGDLGLRSRYRPRRTVPGTESWAPRGSAPAAVSA